MARIMIADNSPSVRFLISILVTQAGHEVVLQANNGREALNVYFETKPDLLIVDFQMPIMDGISLIEEITKEDPDAKVMICTGSIEKLQCDSRMNKGVTVIAKPFNNKDFIESVSTALKN
ncbi:response regulator [Paenibacillus agricola]|uniref:Response regulator n=1 Tax=Paenibacillus agricola TaxID=2716264 RepID=A0ABX0JLA5_9BACL|nr:response regulator [Paenibacillus agricola]NHN34961.1 response regulator [Paenibacillus agricola]